MDILYAWLASIVSGVEPLIIKASSKNLVKNPWLFNILWLSALLPFTMAFAFVQGGKLPVDWGSLFGVGVFSAAFYALYTAALYKIDVSVMAPLFSLRTMVLRRRCFGRILSRFCCCYQPFFTLPSETKR